MTLLSQSTTSNGVLKLDGRDFSKEELYIQCDESNTLDIYTTTSKIYIDGMTFSSTEEFFKYIKDLREENKRLRKRLGLKTKK
jgi:hypothetical protein